MSQFIPKSRRKFWFTAHRTLNDAVLKLHDPLSVGDPKESQERAGLVEDCIAILTMLDFQIGYPDGCSTIRELVELKEQAGTPVVPQPRPLKEDQTPFTWFAFPVVGQNPAAKKVKFDKEEP